MPSPEAGATTPGGVAGQHHVAAIVPAAQRLERDRRALAADGLAAGQADARRAGSAIEPRSEKPLFIEPVPMLAVSPCGNTQE